ACLASTGGRDWLGAAVTFMAEMTAAPAGSLVCVAVALALHPLDEHLADLRTRELAREHLAPGEHLADLRAGEENPVVLAVRTGLGGNDCLALPAVEGVLEHERRDVDQLRVELLEDELRVVRAVVVADAGMVAPDDEVRAAVVLAGNGVEDRLARARLTDRRGEGAKPEALSR